MIAKTADSKKQWLVRKAAGGITILGPFWTDQVRTMIEQGLLSAEDEVCPENSYWFPVRDTVEVKNQIGIDHVPVSHGGDESTQPDLQIEDVVTDPAFENTGLIKVQRSPPQQAASQPVSADELASRFRRAGLSQYLGYGTPVCSSQLFGIEKGRFWSVLFIIGVGLAILGVIWVLKSLKV